MDSCRTFALALIVLLTLPALSREGAALAQQQLPGQTLRGRVVDVGTRAPLIGAHVVVLGVEPILGTATDAAGRYVVPHVPLGRHDVQVSYVGYEPVIRPAVLFTSAKEVVLDVALRENVASSVEVTVTPEVQQGQALNDLALVSARSFSVEETRRYAGGLDDPARLVSAYAGVSGTSVAENAIIVRGNAPKGIQWRLEGVEIPTPSHFAGGNVIGGGMMTLFSTHLLTDSDFLTGAFPASYGNALAGVFDMRLRNGNATRYEHAVQLGLLGVEAASEGPLGQGGASYLFNYRYSTLALLSPLLPTEQVPEYQDLSFKLNVPTRRFGHVTVWGIGGIDALTEPEEADSAKWEYEWDRFYGKVGIDMGAAGLRHDLLVGSSAHLQTRATVTASRWTWEQRRFDGAMVLQDNLQVESTDLRGIFGTQLDVRLGRRHTNQTGANVHLLSYDFAFDLAPGDVPPLQTISAGDGSSTLLQAYTQSKVDLTSRLALNGGVHVQYFALTGHTSVEPRAALQWQFADDQALSFGYGLHSQMEELRVYFAEPVGSAVRTPNRDLDFTKAHHLVLGYDRHLGAAMRLKAEAYYQYLFDVPVIADSSFSMINFGQDWEFSEALVNDGVGRNYGVELTLERFLRRGYYYLVTGSLFDSRYRGGDGIWRDTRWDRTFTVSALFGKEYSVGGDDLLGINTRLELMGGQRYSPPDVAASAADQAIVYDESRAFTRQAPATTSLDVTVTYRRNHRRISEVWALQVRNALVAESFEHDYNYQTRRVEEVRDGIVLPVLSYKVEF